MTDFHATFHTNFHTIGEALRTGARKPEPRPLAWGPCWHFCVEYRARYFLAELGFYIEAFGFEINALSDDYAMVNSPDRSVFIAFVPQNQTTDEPAQLPKLSFMVKNIAELHERFRTLSLKVSDFVAEGGLRRFTVETPSQAVLHIWG